MSEERRGYRTNRVLIESDRILSPQFDDAVVFLSGAQIEMLRNMTQYLRRLDTYASAYHPTHYLTPDVSDYDAILAIVSDLEEVLMGNPNTIWGYKDTVSIIEDRWNAWVGDNELSEAVVPEGEVHKVEAISARNFDSVCSRIIIRIEAVGRDIVLADVASPAADIPVLWNGSITLIESERIAVDFEGCTVDDHIGFYGIAYQMDVP